MLVETAVPALSNNRTRPAPLSEKRTANPALVTPEPCHISALVAVALANWVALISLPVLSTTRTVTWLAAASPL